LRHIFTSIKKTYEKQKLILFLSMISGCGKNEDQQTYQKTESVRKAFSVKQADKSKKPENTIGLIKPIL